MTHIFPGVGSKQKAAAHADEGTCKQVEDKSYYEMLFNRVARNTTAAADTACSKGQSGAGGVKVQDFKQSGLELGLDDEVAASLFRVLDSDGDGEISFDEFVAGFCHFAEAASGGAERKQKQTVIEFCALDLAIAAGFAQGCAVLICDPSERASQFLSYQSVRTFTGKVVFAVNYIIFCAVVDISTDLAHVKSLVFCIDPRRIRWTAKVCLSLTSSTGGRGRRSWSRRGACDLGLISFVWPHLELAEFDPF